MDEGYKKRLSRLQDRLFVERKNNNIEINILEKDVQFRKSKKEHLLVKLDMLQSKKGKY